MMPAHLLVRSFLLYAVAYQIVPLHTKKYDRIFWYTVVWSGMIVLSLVLFVLVWYKFLFFGMKLFDHTVLRILICTTEYKKIRPHILIRSRIVW